MKIGTTLTCLRAWGNLPVLKDLLNISERIVDIFVGSALRSWRGILYGPVALPVSRDFMILFTSSGKEETVEENVKEVSNQVSSSELLTVINKGFVFLV